MRRPRQVAAPPGSYDEIGSRDDSPFRPGLVWSGPVWEERGGGGRLKGKEKAPLLVVGEKGPFERGESHAEPANDLYL